MTMRHKDPERRVASQEAAPWSPGLLRLASLVTVVLVLALGRAEAGVNLKNGNFYLTYLDIAAQGSSRLEMSRTYNSKSNFRGILGWGWSTETQTSLKVLPDGAIIVTENGGGRENLFGAGTPDPRKLDEILVLLKPFKRWGELNIPEQEYLAKVRNDAEFRVGQVTLLYDRKLLKPTRLPVGTILKSLSLGKQYIVKTPAGFSRYYENGRKEHFDQNGQLTRVEEADGSWKSVSYDSQGAAKRISDNTGRSLDFSYNGQGLLERVKDSRGSEISYDYNDLGQLIASNDPAANRYQYEYDNRNNLTSIRYADGLTMEMRYDPMARGEGVKSVRERSGRTFSYEYASDEARHDKPEVHEFTAVTETLAGKTVKKTTYDRFFSIAPSGEQLTRREVVTTDGNAVSYDYDNQGYCLKITTQDGETSYSYDDQHSITRRQTPQVIDSFEYQPTNHKLTSFTETDTAGAVKRKIRYSFSNKWHLLSAADTDGNSLKIEYDGPDISMIRYNSDAVGFTQKGHVLLIDITYDGKKLSAEYDTETRKMVPSGGIAEDELKKLHSLFASIAGYYKVLQEKANVKIVGHPVNCSCTTNQYEIPGRLSILVNFRL